ncbi:nuclear transport factor 2 family protein [Niabella terrae]
MRNLIWLLFIALGWSACNTAADNTDQLEITLARFTKALEESDITTLDQLAAPTLTYGHSSGVIQNKTEYLENFKTGATDFVKINIANQTIDISENTAIVRHTFDADTNDNNTPGHVTLLILTVWQKKGADWLLLARQAVKPPVK